jgi:glycosyltransferase involved in cell wall biosynthesis
MLALMGNQIDRSRLHILGRIPHDQLLALLQISATHVYFTYPYALSWSLLEAMSCGAAVVGSANAPVTEVIHDGQNGRLVPFDQPDALAAVLLELLADETQQLRLGAAARATVQQRFTIGSSVKAYEQLVISLKLAATKA